MTVVLLIYGLTFVVLGVGIFTSPRAGIEAIWVEKLRWVGLFGLLHGANEWVDMLALVSPLSVVFHEVGGPLLLVASFAALLMYPAVVLRHRGGWRRALRFLPYPLFLAVLVLTLASDAHAEAMHFWGRTLLGGPASILTGLMMFWIARDLDARPSLSVTWSLRVAGVGWVLYAVCAGFVVNEPGFLWSSAFNANTFHEVTGVPIQVLRAACALIIAWGMGGAVWRIDQLGRSELRAMRRDLEASVRDRTAQLHKAVQSLQGEVRQRERLQAELLKTAKLESLGVFAGGIAHDYNNLMTVVLGNLALARLDLPDESLATESIDQAEMAAHMATDLAKRLLTFAKGNAPQLAIHSVVEMVENARSLCLSGSNVECPIDSPEGLLSVEVDGGQVGQVLNNVLLNARQAMADGGKVTVTLCNALDRQLPGMETPGDYVSISVKDEGHGIEPDILEHVFDPFFTRREGGSGLGLTVSHSVVTQHKGSIEVHSEPGVGTEVIILLPAVLPKAQEAPDVQSHGAHTAGRVLVMDDEEQILKLMGTILARLGCDFETARHGEGALAAYRAARESRSPFDLVILDLTVRGGMGGKETIAALLDYDPDVVAAVSSGYSTDPVAADYAAYGFKASLPKPYSLLEVRRLLDDVLPERVAHRVQTPTSPG